MGIDKEKDIIKDEKPVEIKGQTNIYDYIGGNNNE